MSSTTPSQESRSPSPEPGPAGPRRGRRSRIRRVGFALGAIGLGLGLGFLILEVVLRVILVRYSESLDRLYDEYSRRPGELFTLRGLVRPSDNPARIYELQPGVRGTFVDVPVEINAAGYRDRERTRKKPPGTFRIAVLGDSVAFGWGVPVDDRFSNRLEVLLNDLGSSVSLVGVSDAGAASPPERRYEVLNFAVPGYNSVMELAVLREDVLAYEPDLVVVSVVPNDAELPNFVREKPHVWALHRSFVFDALRDQAQGLTLGYTARQAGGGLVVAPEFRPELVPKQYRSLMGQENAARALDRIAAEGNSLGMPTVALFHYVRLDPFLNADVTGTPASSHENTPWIQAAQNAGMVVVDPLPELIKYLQAGRLREQALWIKPGEDFHPNGEAHRILAEVLAQAIAGILMRPDQHSR